MKQIKKQLRAFYAANGIGVRRAEKMIKSDLSAVRKMPDVFLCHTVDLAGSFRWIDAPQGWRYWAVRDGIVASSGEPAPASFFHA